jgi:methylmalonyl-CoA mutase
VFLANLGSVAAYTARANFTKNFFEAGGVEAVFGEDGGDVAAGLRASGAKLACICSSDAIYAEQAEPAARALAAAGARVYLAGRPGELEARLRAAGVAEFIYAGGDMFATLQRAFEEAG